MNVIVVIDGREAIPVRAIPMLTNWEQMSPDELADALAGDDHSHQFRSLSAYRLEHGKVVSIPALWWENGPCRKLKALSDRIRATEITHETGYQDWQRQSLLSLPAGAFVWKEEYVPLHERKFNLESITFLSSNTSSGVMAPDEQQRRTVLDFNPFIDDPETGRVVMEGFDTERSSTQFQAETEPEPVVEAPASETPEQRRARWLEWYGKGERGAKQRVFEREKLLNPKADRSYIGKQIEKAKTELAEKKRGGGWTSQLVQDGKR